MKIEHKIVLSNVFNVALILLTGLFAIQNMNNILTKLRFIEIADDLNASFLEMRISEKNYFLYGDTETLREIKEKIKSAGLAIEDEKNDIVRAVGAGSLSQMREYLRDYAETVDLIIQYPSRDSKSETMLRTAGKTLREFSQTMTKLERERMNEIIGRSKKILLYSFWAIFVSAILVSHLISQKILASLRAIEKMTMSISKGDFKKIDEHRSGDEFGSVINAINLMSEELSHREEEIIQSKKLASIGILTAGVAHELTNPLNNISMMAQNFIEYYGSLSEEQRIGLMNKVEGETERIQEIVKNLLDFSKPKEVNLQEADVNSVITKTMGLVQNMLDVSNIRTKLGLAGNLPPVYLDAHQIQQVLVNLITNGVQAMSSGGMLFIGSRLGRKGDTIEITVKDSGRGISPEFLPHIFDPFFSTKGDVGTGLGLSVSYGIVKNHKGEIRVESKPGVGTTFTVELPVNRNGAFSK
jgi:two-component system NtrC family sensor kinase